MEDRVICNWMADNMFLSTIEALRQRKSLALAVGCFDTMHRGHVSLLRYVKTRTWLDPDSICLVVALNSDESVRAIKGPGRPLQQFADRAAVVAAVKGVELVVGFSTTTPEPLLHAIKPELMIKGYEYARVEVPGERLVRYHGGHVLYAPVVDGVSTTFLDQTIRVKSDDRHNTGIVKG